MTFEEILDQAIAMLQRRGRLTYGALQRQFQLDDAALATLKDELLYSQPHVVDDAGRGLVWTSATGTTPDLSPSPPGRLAPAAAGDAAGGGGNLVAASPGRCPPSGGEIARTAGRHEPQSPLAAAGQAGRSPCAAGADLRLVHRGV